MRFGKTIAAAVLVLPLFFAAVAASGTDPLTPGEREFIKARGLIRYAPDPSFPPFEFTDGEGLAHGITPEFLDLIGKKLDIKFTTVAYPTWSAVLDGVKKGQVDLLGTLTKTPERERFLLFSEPYLSVPYVLFVKKEGPRPASLEDAAGLRIGVVKNYGINSWLARNHPAIRPVFVEDTSSGLVKVSTGQLDAMLETLPVGVFVMRDKGLTNLSIVPRHIFSLPQHLAVRTGDETLLSIIKKGLGLLNEAEKTKIFVKWTGEDFSRPPAELPEYIVNITLVLMAVTVLGAIWIILLKRGIRRGVKAVRESEARYRLIADHSTDVIWTMGLDGKIAYVSPSVEKLRGFSAEEVRGQSFQQLLCEGSREMAASAFSAVLERNAAGGSFPENLSPLLLEQPRKDGTTVWTEVVVSPVYGEKGELAGIQGVTRDISERIKAEKEKEVLEEELRQAAKMQAIGTLAGGIAHDFNNILAAIIGYTDLTLRLLPPSSEEARYLNQILKASNRARDLVQQILAISRKTSPGVKLVNLAEIVAETMGLIRATLPATIEITETYAAGHAVVRADPVQFQQVVMNLCANAGYAMKDTGGALLVTLENPVHAAEPQTSPTVRLTLEDTGPGMSPEVLDRIFEPYFTTKPMGEGSGLGLAVVHGIIKQMGGDISVTSIPGRGSRFEITLPALTDGHAEEESARQEQPLPEGTESILLIDDEPDLTEIGKSFLESLGYRVTAVNSGIKALGRFHDAPESFDLILTDLTMPGLNGAEVAAAVHKTRPELPIIMITGANYVLDPGKAMELGIRKFMIKPVSMPELARAVRETLTGET